MDAIWPFLFSLPLFSPDDVILCGWQGSKHQLTLSLSLSVVTSVQSVAGNYITHSEFLSVVDLLFFKLIMILLGLMGAIYPSCSVCVCARARMRVWLHQFKALQGIYRSMSPIQNSCWFIVMLVFQINYDDTRTAVCNLRFLFCVCLCVVTSVESLAGNT